MTPRRWRRLGLGGCLLGVVFAVAVLGSSRTAPVETSSRSGCEVLIQGVPSGNARRPDNAIELSATGSLVASGIDPSGTATAEVHATFAEGLPDRATWNVRRRSFEPPRQDFEVVVAMSEVTGYGVGLVLVTVVTDSCASSAWVDIGDRPAAFTAIGVVGLALTWGGALAVIVNLWRSRDRGAATLPGALGAGLPLGAGLAILAQQTGSTPLAPPALAAWIVVWSGVAGVMHLTRRSFSIWRRDRRERGQRARRDDGEAAPSSSILEER